MSLRVLSSWSDRTKLYVSASGRHKNRNRCWVACSSNSLLTATPSVQALQDVLREVLEQSQAIEELDAAIEGPTHKLWLI